MDIEDEESSPVASVPNENGNLPVNPISEKPSFMHQTNGVSFFLIPVKKTKKYMKTHNLQLIFLYSENTKFKLNC